MINQKLARAKCAVTGSTALRLCEAAHVFPDCWIKDGQYKTMLKDPKQLPKKGLKALLDGPQNRIIMHVAVRKLFDSKSVDGRKLGCFTFIPKLNAKGVVVPGKHEIAVKAAEQKKLAKMGIVHNAVVALPNVNPALLAWHASRWLSILPTAGADVSSSDLDDEDPNDGYVDQEVAEGAKQLLREFLVDCAPVPCRA